MEIWFTSDTHFGHRNILKYEASARPFRSVAEMDQTLIGNWNSVVGEDDLVFHLGDFALARSERVAELLSQLHGRKRLVLGNHDRVRQFDWTGLGFERVYANPVLFDGRFVLSHEPLARIPDGKVGLYGHVHGRGGPTIGRNSLCVCVERHRLSPVPYQAVLRLFPGGGK